MISIIHPSRQRPKQALDTATKWLASMSSEYEYLLSIDASDNISDYTTLFKLNLPKVKILVNDNNTAIEAINHAAKNSKGDLLVVVSDDFDCPNEWDKLLLEQLKGKSDFIVKTEDGCQPWIITLPIMDRVYYERFGYIYYPEYKHMFSDTEMTHVADLLGRKITLPIKFPHRHYTQKGGQHYDEVNKKNDSTWKQGETLYIKRVQEDFGLIGFTGKLNCAPHHAAWLQSNGLWQTA